MASTKIAFPKYRLHRGSGQAFVQIKGKRHYLGTHNTPESKEAYSRFIAEYAVSPILTVTPTRQAPGGLLVVELCAAYWDFAQGYYIKNKKSITSLRYAKRALALFRELYGSTETSKFGPLALKAIQQRLVEQGVARRTVSQYVDVIRRVFKWGASMELLSVTLYQALATVPGLKAGRTTAHDPAPILPVAAAVVDATLPYMPSTVADMVRIQRLTGARPGEVCQLRPMDLDRSGEVWEYRPASHKTEHHDKLRTIYIGPQARAVLMPYLDRNAAAYCFSPAESEEKRHEEQRAKRKTPVQPSQKNRKKSRRLREPKADYTKDSYRRAITRAIKKANVQIDKEAEEMGIDNPIHVPHWHPNQLRHSAATAICKQFGLEAAQVILGHSKADVTQNLRRKGLGQGYRSCETNRIEYENSGCG